MRRAGGGKAVRIAGLVAGLVVLALVLAQIVLPRVAAARIRSRVGRYGHVESVSVSAWPAVKLLWGDADSVRVRASGLKLSPARAAALVWEGRGVGRMDIDATSVKVGPLEVGEAILRKRGASLEGEATTTDAQAKAALPAGVGASLLGSEGGKVQVRVSGGLFGVGASVQAVAEASEGKLIAHPVGFLVEGFRLTLFSDPHVHLVSVGASTDGSEPPAYTLKMSAILG
jgi:LmeA-like phospholipid-binding